MNWVYVDKETYEVKYGVRVDAQPNITGPFDCTRQDRRLTFDGWEGFCAVEEAPFEWALYFDVDDDGLRSKVAQGTRVLEVELTRKEKKWKKDSEERQKDQTTSRAVDAKEDAPVDNPQTTQPELNPPGVNPPGVFGESEPQATARPPLASPMKMPKSIFNDPPRPLFSDPLGPIVPPKTPPPAYSTAAPPPRGASTSPPGSSPPTERRTTPKLNRNSGTRALAQAQKFEALAQRNGKPTSRPASIATSASDYSNPPKTGVTDIFNMYLDRDSTFISSPPPVPQLPKAADADPQAPRGAADPAVFGGFSLKSPRSVTTDGRPAAQPPLRRMNSTRTAANGQAPKAPLPPPPSSRRPPPTNGRAISPEQRRAAASKDGARNPPGGPTRQPTSRLSPPPRQRNGSTSSQNDNSRSGPRPLARTKSMAATMTSGARNRGMAARVSNDGGSPDMPKPARTQTNSNLYREIDNLVNPGRSRAGTVTRTGSATRRDDDRMPPPRRAATSRGPLRDEGGRAGERGRDASRGFVRRPNRDSLE